MNTPQRIVIVGGGTAGWMAASVFARFLDPRLFSVALVESDDIGIVGVGEATIPQLQLLNRALGINEHAFMAATQGTYKLGIEFVGWGAVDSRYIHAFGEVGRDVGLASFHALWRRGQALGITTPLADYSANAMAAAQGRLTKHANGTGSGAYAFHFDASLYAGMMRDLAQKGGVTRHEGIIATVERDAQSGDVTALLLKDGRRIAGDLFIDCSGFASLLLGGALGVPYDSWAHWLPCDRAIAVQSANIASPDPFTRSTAHSAGWQWRIPLRHRTGNGHVSCSAHMGEDEATATLLTNIEGEAITSPRLIRFETGRRRDAWSHNVVALGLAAGFLEPLESTSIHLVQSGVERLVRFLPGAVIHDADRAAFNTQTRAEWENVRDFIIAHYAVNRRDEPFWRACAAIPLPDSLRERLDLFAASGRLFRTSDQLFAEVGWLQVLVGQGMISGDWSPMANGLAPAELAAALEQQRVQVSRQVAAMPLHADYLARHCPSGETRQA